MTREEAIFALEYYKLHFADRVAVESFDIAIKALEQEYVLEKIRATIQCLRNCSYSCSDGIIDDVEDIIDKYIEEYVERSDEDGKEET